MQAPFIAAIGAPAIQVLQHARGVEIDHIVATATRGVAQGLGEMAFANGARPARKTMP